MKKIIFSTLALFLALSLQAQNLNVEPAFWWSGMRHNVLQLMVHGEGIASFRAEVMSDNVYLKETVILSSPNYLILYLDISQSVPETFNIVFTNGRHRIVHPFELKQRNPARKNIQTFSSADVLYLIMPDRFANGDPSNDNIIPVRHSDPVDRTATNRRQGGDLRGISNHLDYLADLGITAIWLNPILENDMPRSSYHGYAATNFYRVDPRLGTNEEFAQLVADANERGLLVIKDMVFNHSGLYHPWIDDLPSRDWINNNDGEFIQTNHRMETLFDIYASDYDRRRMHDGWFSRAMPDLNQRNRHLAKYLIQNSIWWIEFAGINGIRQDTYPYADFNMMIDWVRAIEKEYPGFNIVGEAWFSNPIGTAFFQAGSRVNNRLPDTELRSVMDFRFMSLSQYFFREGGLRTIQNHMAYDFIYEDINNVLRFLDNHDTDRFLREKPTELSGWKQGKTFLLTMTGIPQLYYGTEILMYGNRRRHDGDIRLPFPGGWADDPVNKFTREGRTDLQNEAFDFLRKLLHWRRGNEMISRGGMRHFALQNDVYVYERFLDDRNVIIFMNGSSEEREITLRRYAESIRGRYTRQDFLTGRTVSLDAPTMTLGPREILILE